MAEPNPTFDKLSTAEKVLFVQDLWERIALRPDEVELTDAQRDELDRRLEIHASAPNEVRPWQQVKTRIRARH